MNEGEILRMNTIAPAPGSKPKRVRVGRGIGSGLGKTAGRGHKGSYARTGKGKIKAGFEGGQMPLQRRLPKIGFRSKIAATRAEVYTYQLARFDEPITLELLLDQGLVDMAVTVVKVVLNGEVTKPLHVHGLKVTRGARAAIEAAGGRVE